MAEVHAANEDAKDDDAGDTADADFQLSDCEFPRKRADGGISEFEKQRRENQLHVQARSVQAAFAGVMANITRMIMLCT